MTALAESLERLEDAIAAACRRAGRARGDVELMAVSKTYPASTIAEAVALGLKLFGEKPRAGFAAKEPNVAGLRRDLASPVRIHLIGHLQSNKAAAPQNCFDAVDSIDSLRLAERLNDAASKLGMRLPVLIEVKLSPEETKAGLDPNRRKLPRCWSGCRTLATCRSGA